jgi:glutamate synthase domain-containing protein 2
MILFSRFLPWLLTGLGAVIFYFISLPLSVVLLALFLLGVRDVLQKHHAILRNYPVTGHLRFLLEYIRPEIRQYFLESDEEKLPFSRNQRGMAYSRAKRQNDKRGFGTIVSVYMARTVNGWATLPHRHMPLQKAFALPSVDLTALSLMSLRFSIFLQ